MLSDVYDSLKEISSKMECLGCAESSVYVVRLETLVLDVNMPEKLYACSWVKCNQQKGRGLWERSEVITLSTKDNCDFIHIPHNADTRHKFRALWL